MIKKILVVGLFILPQFSIAKTHSEKRATQMINVLQSTQLQVLLTQEDGVGNITGIKYLYSNKAIWGPDNYELSFNSYGLGGNQVCTVIARVDNRDDSVMSLSETACE